MELYKHYNIYKSLNKISNGLLNRKNVGFTVLKAEVTVTLIEIMLKKLLMKHF